MATEARTFKPSTEETKAAHCAAFVLNDGAGNRSRTYDLRITNALLYQLSYAGVNRSARLGRKARQYKESSSRAQAPCHKPSKGSDVDRQNRNQLQAFPVKNSSDKQITNQHRQQTHSLRLNVFGD